MTDTYNLSTTNQLIPLNDEDVIEGASITYTVNCDVPFDMAVVDNKTLDGDDEVNYTRYDQEVDITGSISYNVSDFKSYSLIVKGVSEGRCVVTLKKGPYVEKQVVNKNVTFEADEESSPRSCLTYVMIILFVIVMGLILYNKLKKGSPTTFFAKGIQKNKGVQRPVKKSFGPF